jgi:hypothetical protein
MQPRQNINTLDYWNRRFGTGDWEKKGGFSQTRAFAESQIPRLGLTKEFPGTLCDFGCGAGDAFPVYRAAYPNASLIGVDFSFTAIMLCQEKYSGIALFINGDDTSVPYCDILIVSNVLEHLDNDKLVVESLLKKCRRLVVVVPYQEQDLCEEHVRVYDADSFSEFSIVRKEVFESRGWSEFGLRRIVAIHMGNVFRRLLGRPARLRKMQILFEISGAI